MKASVQVKSTSLTEGPHFLYGGGMMFCNNMQSTKQCDRGVMTDEQVLSKKAVLAPVTGV